MFFPLILHHDMKRAPLLPIIIGSGFGSGFWPWGPGTAGALLATAIWSALSLYLSPVALFGTTLAFVIVFTALGTWATQRLMPFWGDDPKRVVMDEMVGVWIPLLACHRQAVRYKTYRPHEGCLLRHGRRHRGRNIQSDHYRLGTMGNIRRGIVTFTKAQCSASVATVADFALTIVLAKFCHMWYADATLLGAIFGGIVNCSINYRWVFHALGMKKKYVALRYLLVWIGSIALNTYGTYALTEASGMNFVLSKAIVAVAVAVIWNYQMQRVFVFHANRQKE